MSQTDALHLVISSFPDKESAKATCRILVEEKLAACASLLPGISSIFHWQGRIEHSEECLVLLKSPRQNYLALEDRLRSLHPYEVPEILAFAADRILDAYAAWAAKSTCTDHTQQ